MADSTASRPAVVVVNLGELCIACGKDGNHCGTGLRMINSVEGKRRNLDGLLSKYGGILVKTGFVCRLCIEMMLSMERKAKAFRQRCLETILKFNVKMITQSLQHDNTSEEVSIDEETYIIRSTEGRGCDKVTRNQSHKSNSSKIVIHSVRQSVPRIPTIEPLPIPWLSSTEPNKVIPSVELPIPRLSCIGSNKEIPTVELPVSTASTEEANEGMLNVRLPIPRQSTVKANEVIPSVKLPISRKLTVKSNEVIPSVKLPMSRTSTVEANKVIPSVGPSVPWLIHDEPIKLIPSIRLPIPRLSVVDQNNVIPSIRLPIPRLSVVDQNNVIPSIRLPIPRLSVVDQKKVVPSIRMPIPRLSAVDPNEVIPNIRLPIPGLSSNEPSKVIPIVQLCDPMLSSEIDRTIDNNETLFPGSSRTEQNSITVKLEDADSLTMMELGDQQPSSSATRDFPKTTSIPIFQYKELTKTATWTRRTSETANATWARERAENATTIWPRGRPRPEIAKCTPWKHGIEALLKPKPKPKPKKPPKTHICILCNVNFSHINEHQQHWEEVHDKHFEIVEHSVTTSPAVTTDNHELSSGNHNKAVPIKQPPGRRPMRNAYKCLICEKIFPTKSHARCHLRIHADQKPYPCSLCEKSFGQKKSLALHMRKHTGEKPYKCPLCGKHFVAKHSLQEHKEIVHLKTKKRPYVCEVCGKCFHRPSLLQRHQTIHSSERPYLCNVCGKAFKHRVDLAGHAVVHSDTAPRCTICNKVFRSEQTMTEHIQVVHEKQCLLCKEMIPTMKSYKAHKVVCLGIPSEQINSDDSNKGGSLQREVTQEDEEEEMNIKISEQYIDTLLDANEIKK